MADRNGFKACDSKLEALHRELSPIMKAIMLTRATSMAGLRVKIASAIEANGHLWHAWGQAVVFRDMDYDSRGVRSLIEAACAVTDVPVPDAQSKMNLTNGLTRLRAITARLR